MRIHSIANSPNFGYNKKLNDTVNDKLKNAKGNRELAYTLLEMNKFCNSTEDELRAADKANNTRMTEAYANIFLNVKPILTEMLDQRFPKLKYRETEYKGYKRDIKNQHIKDEWHWLYEITEDLMDQDEYERTVLAKYGTSLDKDSSQPVDLGREKIGTDSTEKSGKTKKQAKTQDCPYLEKYVPTEYSPTGFSSLGGMDKIKETLIDKIIYPAQNPEMAKLDEIEYGKKMPRGELFYGPPGCGKTAIMQALSAESGIPLYMLKISKAGSKYINESSNNAQAAYDYLVKLAEETGKPVIMAMDEMESLTAKRSGGENGKEDDKLVGTLLQIIEEARGKNVIILGATNYYDQLDDAIKSRLEDKIYIGLPDDETRESVLKVLLNRILKGRALAANPEELAKVVKLTKGFSNRDLTILTDKAAMIARSDGRRNIVADDYIVPVRDNQNMKVKESHYQASQARSSVGFMK